MTITTLSLHAGCDLTLSVETAPTRDVPYLVPAPVCAACWSVMDIRGEDQSGGGYWLCMACSGTTLAERCEWCGTDDLGMLSGRRERLWIVTDCARCGGTAAGDLA